MVVSIGDELLDFLRREALGLGQDIHRRAIEIGKDIDRNARQREGSVDDQREGCRQNEQAVPQAFGDDELEHRGLCVQRI
jgi:hypothetical protein